jgi:hypothetical protein
MGLFGTAPFVPTPPTQYRGDVQTKMHFDTPDTLAKACAHAILKGEDNDYVHQGTIMGCSGTGDGPHVPSPTWPDKYAKTLKNVIGPGDQTANVSFDSPEALAHACADALACRVNGVVHVPNANGYSDPYAQIVAHEDGHINGWPSDHPKATK